MNIVAVKEMSAGNESVGSMWKETKIFPFDATVFDIMRWAGLKVNVVLTIPENCKEDYFNELDKRKYE